MYLAYDQKGHISPLIFEYFGHIKEIYVTYSMAMTVETYNGYKYYSGTKWHSTSLQTHIIAPDYGVSAIRGERYKKCYFFLNFNESCMISYVCLLFITRRVDS